MSNTIHICLFLLLISLKKITAQLNPRVSFIPNTSKYTLDGRDGVVEVKLENIFRGTICDINFGQLEAALLCYEMGFEPDGVAILNAKTQGTEDVALSHLDCSERVMKNDLKTWKLRYCSYRTGASNIPSICKDHSRDVHLLCFKKRPTTPLPPVTIPTIHCNSSGMVSPFRLSGGNGWSGKLLYHHNQQWGTTCIEGMDVNAAKAICASLCLGADSFPLARIVAHTYADPSSKEDIVLSGVSCPSGAKNFSSDCSYVVGDAGGCSHSQDAGIECGSPPEMHFLEDSAPNVTCINNEAHVCFAKRNPYAFLNASFISLVSNGASKQNCTFHVKEEGDCVIAVIPLYGCGSIVTSNSTHTLISHTLQRWTPTSPNGIYTAAPYTLMITCALSRFHSANHAMVPRLIQFTRPMEPMKNEEFRLHLYKDVNYLQRLPHSAALTLKDTVFVRASLDEALPTSRLILHDCWASNHSSVKSERLIYIIRDRCPTVPNVHIEFHNDTDIRIRFPLLHLAAVALGEIPRDPLNEAGLSFFCSGYTCDKRSSALQTPECFRACISTKTSSVGTFLTETLNAASPLNRKRRSNHLKPVEAVVESRIAMPSLSDNEEARLRPKYFLVVTFPCIIAIVKIVAAS